MPQQPVILTAFANSYDAGYLGLPGARARPCATMSTKPTLHPPKPGFLLLEVVYGLVSRDCRGMGICKFIKASASLLSTTANPCGSSMAWGGIGEEGRFELLVLRNTVNEEQWERRFATEKFVLKEAFCMPEGLFQQAVSINAGEYTIAEGGPYLYIQF